MTFDEIYKHIVPDNFGVSVYAGNVLISNGVKYALENPATPPNYLITGQNFPTPTIIDKNRMLRGDVFKKPTAYWFFNCEPTHGFTLQNDKEQKLIQDCRGSNGNGLCSQERSMIHPDYARNWICDFILGKPQNINQLSFNFDGGNNDRV